MNTTYTILYNETLKAISRLESGLIAFNNGLTEHNKQELERYIKVLDWISLDFELCYKGPALAKLKLLRKAQYVRGEAVIAIHEFNQLSSI